ncbi:NUDIX domain-containing protein [Candidatus Micrarchaeota archaeon]|nr:NUDIX domain-containing protein [Candidatus Micrarchaeota archaeon]
MNSPYPQVGVGVMLIRNGKILLGKRKNSHGSGSWAFPGGRLEFGESPEDCARREVLEETGIIVHDLEHFALTSDFFENEKEHYVTLFLLAKQFEGESRILEPHKCEEWKWFALNDLPSPKFLSLENLLRQKDLTSLGTL